MKMKKAKMSKSRLPEAIVAISVLGLSQIATAQLEEIVVTAQKRSESINDIGLTVQAMSGDELLEKGIDSVQKLVKVVPGLSYANSYYNTPVYTLRGVGFYENSLAVYPAVSIYVDEIPMVFPVLSSQASMDVERVEVLKGPQGTLFGQNATGGAINYIAAKPTSEFAVGTDLSYNEYGQLDANGFITGAVSDTVNGRLSVTTSNGGAWQESATHGGELGDKDLFAARLLLDWTPSERLNVLVNLNGYIDKSDPQAGQYFNLLPQIPGNIDPILANAPKATDRDNRTADWTENSPPRGDDTQYQSAVRITYDITDDISMTSITSYTDFERDQYNDPDGVNGDALEFAMLGELSSFVQELRLANGNDNKIRWMIGANYEQSESEEYAFQHAGISTVGTNYLFPARTNDMFLNTDIASYGIFTNADWDVTEQITLKAGVRYTETERDAATCTLDTGDGFLIGFYEGISQLISGSTTPPSFPGRCITLDSDTYLPAGVFEDTLTEDNISWRIGVDYAISQDVLLYANVAKGYKAGSYLFVNASQNGQFAPVVQESVLSYEAGFKASLLGSRMQLNGAVFYYDYKDKQLRGKLNDIVFNVLDALVNVPESELMGAEISMAYLPFEDLSLSLSATYVDSEVTEYTGVAFNGGSRDYAGTSIPFSPDLSVSASAEYRIGINSNWEGFVGGNLIYNDETYAVIGDVEDAKLRAYTVIDLRAGIRTFDGTYSITVFGENVDDEWYYVNAPVLYDTQVRYTGAPQTWGVRFSYRM